MGIKLYCISYPLLLVHVVPSPLVHILPSFPSTCRTLFPCTCRTLTPCTCRTLYFQGVSVEAVDPVFQAKMLDMLRQTGRPEMVVGWYHSHPGFGCWLSGVDINTQQSFEALSERAVAVVVDPIQSVKGKVRIRNC